MTRPRPRALPRDISLLIPALLLFAGCERQQVTSYTVPKQAPPAASAAATGAAPAAPGMDVLPGMQAQAAAAGELEWTVPEGWTEQPASGIRKGTFTVAADGLSAEVSVLAFPGDVGGALANLNRWLGQIGREPVEAGALPELAPETTIAAHPARRIRLEGDEQSILGASIEVHGYTWFVKMLGDSELVLGQAPQMEAFLASLKVKGDSHGQP